MQFFLCRRKFGTRDFSESLGKMAWDGTKVITMENKNVNSNTMIEQAVETSI